MSVLSCTPGTIQSTFLGYGFGILLHGFGIGAFGVETATEATETPGSGPTKLGSKAQN